MRIVVPGTAALIPLIISPGLLFHYDITPKVVLLLMAVALSALFWRENADNVAALIRSRLGRRFCILVTVQLVWFAVASVVSEDRSLSLHGTEWRSLGLITYAALAVFALLTAGWVQRTGNLVLLLRACAVSGALIAGYVALQYFGIDPFIDAAAYRAGEGPFTIVRPPGTVGHANYVAPVLVFGVFCALALARHEQAKSHRRILWAAAAFMAFATLLTGTRAGLAGLIAGGAVIGAFEYRKIRRRHLVAACAAIALVIAGFIASPAGTKLRARIHWSGEDPFGGARLLLWRDSLRMAAARPVFGFGPETFSREFPRFQSLELARAYPDFYHESPHNIVLDALTAQGVAGAVLFLTIWGLAVLAGNRARRRGSLFAVPMLACAVALLVVQQFSVFVVATALCSYITLAVLVGISVDRGAEPARQQTRRSKLLMPIGVAGAVFFAIVAIRLVIADAALTRAHHYIANRDIAAAQQAWRTHENWAPGGRTAELFYSRAMAGLAGGSSNSELRLEASKAALKAAARAAEYSEQRHNAWYNLATLLASQGDADAVERALRNAIAWAPNWFKPRWALAQLLQMSGRRREALEQASAALERSGGKYPEVVATWAALAHAQAR